MSLFNTNHNLCSVLFSLAAVWKFNEILIKQSLLYVQGTHVHLGHIKPQEGAIDSKRTNLAGNSSPEALQRKSTQGR